MAVLGQASNSAGGVRVGGPLYDRSDWSTATTTDPVTGDSVSTTTTVPLAGQAADPSKDPVGSVNLLVLVWIGTRTSSRSARPRPLVRASRPQCVPTCSFIQAHKHTTHNSNRPNAS
jgi:hypothetical protein